MSGRTWVSAAPLLVAAAVRVALLPLARLIPDIGDSHGYLFLAREWAEFGRFSWLRSGVRPPLHRMLVAPGLDASTDPAGAWPGVYLIQIACDLATCALLMHLGRRLAGARAGAATGWLYALFPPAIFWSATVVMAETAAALTTALALVSLWVLAGRLAAARSFVPAGLALGLALGLGVLTKQSLAAVALACAAAVLLLHDVPWRRRFGALLLVAAVALGTTVPWALHTRAAFGVPLLSGTYGTYNALIDNAPPGVDAEELWFEEPDIGARVTAARAAIRETFLHHPGQVLRRAADRLRLLLGPEVTLPVSYAVAFDNYQPVAPDSVRSVWREAWAFPTVSAAGLVQLVCQLGGILLLSLGLAGLVDRPSGILASASRWMLLLSIVVLAATLAAARYRFAFVPFLAPFAGHALVAWRAGTLGPVPRRTAWCVAYGLTAAGFLLPAP